MASYRIEFKRSVKRDFKYIPKSDIINILDSIKALSAQPRPPQTKKLTGQDRYRLRCGHYRVLYEIKDQILLIMIVKVRHRKNVYR